MEPLEAAKLAFFNHKKSLSGDGRGLITSSFISSFKCCQEDEVFLNGNITRQPAPPFACKFNPTCLHGNLLAVVDEEGSVRLLDTRKLTTESLIKEWSAHKNAIFDMCWVADNKLVTASGDSSLILWDVTSNIAITKFKGHISSVKSVDLMRHETDVFVSGGRDGYIIVWDTRCNTKGSYHRPVNMIQMGHCKIDHGIISNKKTPTRRQTTARTRTINNISLETQVVDKQNGVTSVLFHKDNKIASCGAVDGTVKLWDMRRTYSNITSSPPPAWYTFTNTGDTQRQFGFTSLISDCYESCLYAGCMDNIVYVYDSTRLKTKPVKAFSGHQNSTFYVKLDISCSGRFLLSGSSCGNAFIWDIDNPLTPPSILTGHTKEVTAVAWNPSQLDKIVTCSDACDIRIWRLYNEQIKCGHNYIGFAKDYTGQEHIKGSEVIAKYHQTHDIHISLKTNQPILRSVENTISPLNTLLSDLPTKCKMSGKTLTNFSDKSDCIEDYIGENCCHRNSPESVTTCIKRPLSHTAVSTKRCRVSDSVFKSETTQISRKTKNQHSQKRRKKDTSTRMSGKIDNYLKHINNLNMF